MTRDEANAQVAALARRLGHRTPAPLPVRALVGEAFLDFSYVEAGQALSVVAPVYRFRAAPRPGVLEAVLAAATRENTGGGRLVVEGDDVVLRRDFVERTAPRRFAEEIDVFAGASLLWVRDLFARAAERAIHPPQPSG